MDMLYCVYSKVELSFRIWKPIVSARSTYRYSMRGIQIQSCNVVVAKSMLKRKGKRVVARFAARWSIRIRLLVQHWCFHMYLLLDVYQQNEEIVTRFCSREAGMILPYGASWHLWNRPGKCIPQNGYSTSVVTRVLKTWEERSLLMNFPGNNENECQVYAMDLVISTNAAYV